MSEIHALSGAYAVDAVNDVERKLFEQHLAHCPDCRDEVASLREAASLLPETAAVAPPPALRDRVLAEIASVRPLPPVTVETGPVEPTNVTSLAARRRRRLPALAAAAAVAAMLGAGAVAWQPWETTPEVQQRQLTAAERIAAADDAQEIVHEFEGGAVATVIRSRELGQAVITTSDMPAAPAGKVYQLWLQDPTGQMRPAGLMEPLPAQTVVLEGDAASARAAGITVEPAGGSERPTTAPLAVFDFERSV
ncbi:anti-sigma factor [Nocardioides donggukensis]|uniref:Regulator of SigK n=1 Tax=Nocardioides donggukensis TaxID=2774019 RepID=A0A927K6M6_9ACTN|nr:anti-sigma factor [Nocardioides donggukensis]MBD8871174.1 anti-sigma factor [Nocardioides donggukensis]